MNEPTINDLVQACKGTLSNEDCDDLADMPFEEALGYAFSLLADKGLDPEEFLKTKGILE